MDDLFFSRENVSRIFREKRGMADDSQVLIYSNADIMTSRHPSACAHRLFDLLPDAEVIVVIRNQFSALASYWANHGAFLKPAPQRYFRRYVPFNEWLAWGLDFLKVSPLANFLYWEQINLYSSLWGKDKIHVILYEDLVAQSGSMFQTFSKILEVDCLDQDIAREKLRERKRNSKREMTLYSFFGRYLGADLLDKEKWRSNLLGRIFVNWLEGGAAINPHYSPELRDRVIEAYAESNARLNSDWGLDLAPYGYPIK